MNTEAKKGIENLVNKYKAILAQGKVKSYNEAQTRNEFIEPFFEYLGWDMRNLRNENEVMTEETTSKGRIDLAFRLNNIPVMFLEAKALKADLDDWRWAEQAINYSWNKGVTWAVLTDFESIKVFNAEIPPKGVSDNLFFELSHQDYINKFDQLWLLSREGFKQGLLTQEAQKWGKITKRKQVGEKLFEDLTAWRSSLSKGFAKKNRLEQDELDEGVQRVLDRLIFIRAAEDRDIEPNTLLSLLRSWKSEGHKGKLYHSLVKVFRQFDDGYNSKIFAVHYSEEWEIDNDIVVEVINGLYSTKDGYRYDFAAISADVLGGIYEQYLGHVLKQAKKSARVTETHKKRKSQGIYYTPHYIVDYIVKETLGEVLKTTKPKDISKIKVLDPACGSGSFLTAAYDEILNYYEKHSAKQTLFTKFDILKENIYGVDLDTQAVEITQLNLLLKALSQKARLPTLQHNIRVGNSLISGNEETLKPYFADDWQKQKPFNWQEEFKDVFKQGGFDVIIGNPPYVRPENVAKDERNYYLNSDTFDKTFGRFDLYILFIEKALKLLKNGGYFAFIIPTSLFNQNYSKDLRKWILDEFEIRYILDLSEIKVFKSATIQSGVIVIRKKTPFKLHKVTFEKPKSPAEIKNKIAVTLIPQNIFLETPQNMIRTDLNEDIIQIINKINLKSLKVGDICYVVIGAVPHDTKTGASKDRLISKSKTKNTHKKYIEGKDIGRHRINWRGIYLDYLPKEMHRPKFPELFENKKLIIRNISTKEGLLAVKDEENFYTNDTVSLCVPWHLLQTISERGVRGTEKQIENSRRYSLEYLVAVVNSKLINFYFKKILSSTLHVYPEAIRNLPIYNIVFSNPEQKGKYDSLANLAQQILDLNKELAKTTENTDRWNKLRQDIGKTDYRIDEEVYKLYGLSKEEIKIVEGARIG